MIVFLCFQLHAWLYGLELRVWLGEYLLQVIGSAVVGLKIIWLLCYLGCSQPLYSLHRSYFVRIKQPHINTLLCTCEDLRTQDHLVALLPWLLTTIILIAWILFHEDQATPYQYRIVYLRVPSYLQACVWLFCPCQFR